MKVNTVIQGDSLEVMQGIPDGSIDLVVTDPPYFGDYKTRHRKDKSHNFCKPIENDKGCDKQILIDFIPQAFRVMKDNSAMYMFCNSIHIDFFKIEVEKYFTIKNIIVWIKNNLTAGDLKGAFGRQYEFIILANKGRKEINGKRWSDCWEFNRVSGGKQLHQNEKPIDLINRCILSHSSPSDVVLDGFMGSGTTCVAAKQLGRHYIGIELEEKYCEIARTRLAQRELF